MRSINRVIFVLVFVAVAAFAAAFADAEPTNKEANPMVILETTEGAITIELWPEKAPITVENFLNYVEDGFYDGTVFHRVIDGFMIQGGGFTADMQQKNTKPPIKNEAAADLKNDRGTIAMARTNVVDSATAQFFINHKDNDFLNHQNETPQGYGYAVFGKVVAGMDVVDKIATVKTGGMGFHRDVPVTPVAITSAKRLTAEAEKK
ncbi:MAG: peptidyl-prolyl cis-trans isomerase [Deltaproteobacteria bacterium]|nr:peptidyl-prolyl cis-trans isomerase [Deltaproteobacteria bacterium]